MKIILPKTLEYLEIGFASIEHLMDFLESDGYPLDKRLSLSDCFLNVPVSNSLFENRHQLFERIRNFKRGINTPDTVDTKYLAYLTMCKIYDVLFTNTDAYKLTGRKRTDILNSPEHQYAYQLITDLFDSGLINMDNRAGEKTQLVLETYKAAYELITIDDPSFDQVRNVIVLSKISIDAHLKPFNLYRYKVALENMVTSRLVNIKPDYDELTSMFKHWDDYSLSQQSYLVANFINYLPELCPGYNPLDVLTQYAEPGSGLVSFLSKLQPLYNVGGDLTNPENIFNCFSEPLIDVGCPGF